MTDIDISGAEWRKSRYSNGEGNCVEVATAWRKSRYSNCDGNCVEVGQAPARVVAVRDTTDRQGPSLAFQPAAWAAFAAEIRAGRVVSRY